MPEEIQNSSPNFATVSRIIELLEPLTESERELVLRTVSTWYRLGVGGQTTGKEPAPLPVSPPLAEVVDDKFSNRAVLSAKEFIFEKDPLTEVERLACLAYYLTHYLDTPHFKNVDLSRLNTEAAQRKLSNPAVAANNAMRDGYFVQAPKSGFKQLSAMGERFVQLLPDRDAAQKVKQRMSPRRGKRSGNGPAGDNESSDEKPEQS